MGFFTLLLHFLARLVCIFLCSGLCNIMYLNMNRKPKSYGILSIIKALPILPIWKMRNTIKRLEKREVWERSAIFISYLGINKYSRKLINSVNEGFHTAVHIYNNFYHKKSWKLKTQYKKITGKTEIEKRLVNNLEIATRWSRFVDSGLNFFVTTKDSLCLALDLAKTLLLGFTERDFYRQGFTV